MIPGHHPTVVPLFFGKPFFFNGLKNEFRFSDQEGDEDPGIQ
jgi:hypothetical protein